MSYESPIKLIEDKVKIELDNMVVRAVQNYGLTIDRDALIKALNYDREQYEKGFEDGKRAIIHGFWKYGEDRFGVPNWECSACGCHGRGDYNYCPWCGAKMYED